MIIQTPTKNESVTQYCDRIVGDDTSHEHLVRCRQAVSKHFHGISVRVGYRQQTFEYWKQVLWRDGNISNTSHMLISDGTLVAFTYAEDAVNFKLTYDPQR